MAEEYGEYLTSWMRTAAEREEKGTLVVDPVLFNRTFALLNDQLGDGTFRRWDADRAAHLGPFSIACYEFVTSGVAADIDGWESGHENLRDRVRSVWTAEEFRANSGTGVSPRRRVPRLINEARKYFARS